MHTKQTIAIIGSEGERIAAIANAAAHHYQLLLFAADREKGEALVQQIVTSHPGADVEFAVCPFNASWEADLIIVSVPQNEQILIADKIADVAIQKTVIVLGDEKENTINDIKKILPYSKLFAASGVNDTMHLIEQQTN